MRNWTALQAWTKARHYSIPTFADLAEENLLAVSNA
jgi:hypothetical protein